MGFSLLWVVTNDFTFFELISFYLRVGMELVWHMQLDWEMGGEETTQKQISYAFMKSFPYSLMIKDLEISSDIFLSKCHVHSPHSSSFEKKTHHPN